MAKTPPPSLDDLTSELRVTTGKLLETGSALHSFVQSMQSSGFKEYVDYMGRPWYLFWLNLLMGIARGLGFVIGATVVVAIVVFIISRILTQLPFVGHFFEVLQQFFTEENIKQLQQGNALETISNMFEAFKASVVESQQTVIQP